MGFPGLALHIHLFSSSSCITSEKAVFQQLLLVVSSRVELAYVDTGKVLGSISSLRFPIGCSNTLTV